MLKFVGQLSRLKFHFVLSQGFKVNLPPVLHCVAV